MNILTRGTVIDIGEQKVVVLLERASKNGWNCLCISAHSGSVYYYREDIFVFDEDLRDGKIIPQVESR